ncbi:MAG TPA: hypothetical protein VMH02_09855 [Verrucomicrobiae bacterium]|nr:hypothetical protein [Verrucomicrobiae bacterium]
MTRAFAAFAALLLASPAVCTAGPVRHLEYAFTIYPTAKVARGAIGQIEGPGTGTMSVDVGGLAPDGGTIVEATQWWWHAVRPEQTRTCEVYANGSLSCGALPLPSPAENVLLPLLARDFYGAGSSWRRDYTMTYTANQYRWTAALDLRVVGGGEVAGKRVVRIASKGVLTPVGGPLNRLIESGTIAYDPARGIPIAVHDERAATSLRSIDAPRSVDLALISDSLSR